MTSYACGHEPSPIIISNDALNALSIVAYFEWKDSVGFDGDNTLCFPCWCDKGVFEKMKYSIKGLSSDHPANKGFNKYMQKRRRGERNESTQDKG